LGRRAFNGETGWGDKTFGFGAASAPVFGGKAIARNEGRLKELNAHLGFTGVGLPDFNDLA